MSKGSKYIEKLLTKEKIIFSKEVKYNCCKGDRLLPFDFQICINDRIGLVEYDGKQHFEKSSMYHKKKGSFEKEKNHDIKKTNYCIKSGISLLRLSYDLSDEQIAKMLELFVTDIQKNKIVYYFESNDDKAYNYLKANKYKTDKNTKSSMCFIC